LVLSDSFRKLIFDSNNNYRFVEICIQRLLGRKVYSDREKIAWSILVATKGIQGFVDELLNSEEYLTCFGDSTVPYQRRRSLPHQIQGEVTFAHTTRYGADYRDRLPKQVFTGNKGAARLDYLRWEWQKNPPQIIGKIGGGIVIAGAGFIGLLQDSILKLGFVGPLGYVLITLTSTLTLAKKAKSGAKWLAIVLPTMQLSWGFGYLYGKSRRTT
jgi:phycobilisome rod-core linker protein